MTDSIEHLEDFLIREVVQVSVRGLDWDVCLQGCEMPALSNWVIQEEFERSLGALRPYPAPAETLPPPISTATSKQPTRQLDLLCDLLYRTIYFVTHLIYANSGFALRPLLAPWYKPERAFLRAVLIFQQNQTYAYWNYGKLKETDLTGEVIDCLLILGARDDDPLIRKAREILMERQHASGGWGSSHAFYNALNLNGLALHDWLNDSHAALHSVPADRVLTGIEYERGLQALGLRGAGL